MSRCYHCGIRLIRDDSAVTTRGTVTKRHNQLEAMDPLVVREIKFSSRGVKDFWSVVHC